MALPDIVTECAERVNDELGPGFREHAYHEALLVELTEQGILHNSETTIPVMYRDIPIARMHPDLVVGDTEKYIVELKVDRDGSAQCARYLDHAESAGMSQIVGGIAISFGTELEVTDV